MRTIKNPSGCRLCALSIDRFSIDIQGATPLKVWYKIHMRSHFSGFVNEICFCPAGSNSDDAPTVRLRLQHAKKDFGLQAPTDARHKYLAPMVPYARILSNSTNSEESLAVAAKWLRDCLETHEACKSIIPDISALQMRFIETQAFNDDDIPIRLRKGQDLPPDTPYATLSHC